MSTIFPELEDGAINKKIYYRLYQLDRIGQIAEEIYYLRNVFRDWNTNNLSIITMAPEKCKRQVNLEFLKSATSEMDVLYSQSDIDVGRFHQGDKRFFNLCVGKEYIDVQWDVTTLKMAFITKCGSPYTRIRLTDEQEERGLKLQDRLSIPKDARIVCVHVREPGYLPDLAYHAYRDSNIKNYMSAINYLLDSGYYVVRLGDTSMVEIGNIHDHFHDMPFSPHYEQLVDPYFLSKCEFLLGTMSGPLYVALAFGRPVIVTNCPIYPDLWGNPGDLIVPKHYYSKQLKRKLTFPEVILSPIIDFSDIDQFTRIDIELHENTEQEILEAVQEMINQSNTEVPKPQRAWGTIANKARELYVGANARFFSMYHYGMRIPESYININPDYLGHDWSSLIIDTEDSND